MVGYIEVYICHHSFLPSINMLSGAHHASRSVPDIVIVEVDVAQSHLESHTLVKDIDVQTKIFQNHSDPDS